MSSLHFLYVLCALVSLKLISAYHTHNEMTEERGSANWVKLDKEPNFDQSEATVSDQSEAVAADQSEAAAADQSEPSEPTATDQSNEVLRNNADDTVEDYLTTISPHWQHWREFLAQRETKRGFGGLFSVDFPSRSGAVPKEPRNSRTGLRFG